LQGIAQPQWYGAGPKHTPLQQSSLAAHGDWNGLQLHVPMWHLPAQQYPVQHCVSMEHVPMPSALVQQYPSRPQKPEQHSVFCWHTDETPEARQQPPDVQVPLQHVPEQQADVFAHDPPSCTHAEPSQCPCRLQLCPGSQLLVVHASWQSGS
jgi:hypothetical protein